MRFAVIAHRPTPTNVALAAAMPPELSPTILTPAQALVELRAGDVALGRIDVLETLDGIEPGLWALTQLAHRGVRVLNGPRTLVSTHDKLATAAALARAGVPHPATVDATSTRALELDPPVVAKPRFGSWGQDVELCPDLATLGATLERFSNERWFQASGAVVQQLLPPCGDDLRVVVACGRIVGAIHRISAPGEWRTNVSLGGTRQPVVPTAAASALALAAATAVSGDLVGVDMMPDRDGTLSVLEVNGAVDFTIEYSQACDVFAAVSAALLGIPIAPSEPDETAAAIA